MEDRILNFMQANSPDGGFLQSVYWQKFQESVGRKTYSISETGGDKEMIACANVIEHILPLVGKYFYVPRGPIIKDQNYNVKVKTFFDNLINLSKENNVGWIRIEPNSEKELVFIKENLPDGIKIKKSAVDMQPSEILILDISKSEEEFLAGMKQKTRYNIRLAEKKGVKIYASQDNKEVDNFFRLVEITSKRDRITAHPESYYRKMFDVIPPEILKLYVARYEGKIICANLVLFFGGTATYMHGASDNDHRNVMAPYLLQWQQIRDAKKEGCTRYDFGGVKVKNESGKSWAGVTKFKTGFAPDIEPIQFPGCYDLVLNTAKYMMYRLVQRIKRSI